MARTRTPAGLRWAGARIGRKHAGSLGLLCALWASSLWSGCDDLEDFKTAPGEAFRGSVFGNEPRDAGTDEVVERSFLLHGFDSATLMELTFDPALVPTGRSPGELHTFVCADRKLDGCSEDEQSQGPFDHAALHQVAGLSDDVLSQYDFPGPSRVRNYILHARLNGSGVNADNKTSARHAMVFLSLMESGRIEVRVIAPGDSGQEAAGPLFGIFRLGRVKK